MSRPLVALGLCWHLRVTNTYWESHSTWLFTLFFGSFFDFDFSAVQLDLVRALAPHAGTRTYRRYV